MLWKLALGSILRSGVTISMVGGAAVVGGYVIYRDLSRYRRMAIAYTTGNILAPLETATSASAGAADKRFRETYLKRPELEAVLRDVVFAPHFTGEYYVVDGPTGCGKSRLIVEVVQSLIDAVRGGPRNGGAPLYVDVAQGDRFVDNLSKVMILEVLIVFVKSLRHIAVF